MKYQGKTRVFNKEQMINNVMYLLKLKGRRIGELEEYAGLSAGYIARSRNSSNTTKPGIEYIMKIADFFEVTIDALLKADLTKLSASDQYWIGFARRLTDATRKDKVSWQSGSNMATLKMQDGSILQIRSRKVGVKKPENTDTMVKDIWLQKPKASLNRICSSENNEGPLIESLDELYMEAVKNASRPKIDKDTKNMLDDFLIMLEEMK